MAYPGLRDVPGVVDLAVIATPAATVPGIVAAAAGKGVAAEQAVQMLRSLRGTAVFGGLRGSPPVGLAAVVDVIVAVSELMTDNPQLAELDLNPVLADENGCDAVDWRIRIMPQEPGSSR